MMENLHNHAAFTLFSRHTLCVTLSGGRMCDGTSASSRHMTRWRGGVGSAQSPDLCKGSRCAAAVTQETVPHPPHTVHLLSALPDSHQQVRATFTWSIGRLHTLSISYWSYIDDDYNCKDDDARLHLNATPSSSSCLSSNHIYCILTVCGSKRRRFLWFKHYLKYLC